MTHDTSWHGSHSAVEADPTASMLHGVWRRKSLVALGTLVGLVIATLYYNQQETVYQSDAQVLVVHKRPGALAGAASDPNALLGERGIPHERLIKSPLIAERTVNRGDLPDPETYGGSHDPVAAMIRSLTVSYSANMLELSFRGTNADACQQVLAAIVESYREFLDETYQNANDDTLRLVTQKAADIQDELRKKGDEYQEFHERTPLTWLGQGGGGVYDERLAAIEKKRSEQQLVQAELRTRLTAIQEAIAKQRDESYLHSMIAGTAEYEQLTRSRSEKNEPARLLRTDTKELLTAMLDKETLSETFGPEYPDVRALQRKIDLIQQLQTTAPLPNQVVEAEPKRLEGAPAASEPSLLEAYVQLLEQQLEESDRMEATLAQLYEQEHEAARKLSIFQFEDKRLSSDIERAEQFYSNLMTQLQSMGVGKDLGGYTTSVIAPSAKGRRISPVVMRIIPAGGLLGFLAGCALAYLAELSDKSFRSPNEISQRLQLPVIGHVQFNRQEMPLTTGDTSPLDRSLCVYHAAHSPQAEAYRAVRTSLYFSTRGEEHSVFQITSPSAGDGKTTLAGNLAASFALTGERTLLIDADLRKPRIHKLFGIEAADGLAAVIDGAVDVAEAIVESGISGLHLLPAGKVPSNPAELLSKPRFKELIDVVREQYDYVIVDTPPLLAVTDPCAVAPRVDGVIMTIRISKNGRPQAERAKAILAAHKAKLLGVVVNDADNALQSQKYGYGYGYGYAYGYGQSSNEAYASGYHDDVQPRAARFDTSLPGQVD